MNKPITIAVTGLNATDNPAPGVGVLRALRESGPKDRLVGLAYDALDPGVYAAETYVSGEVLEHAAKTIGGKIEDKVALNKALHEAKVPETLRGPVSFDKYGNVVGNIYIRKVEKKGDKYVNAVAKTYPNVSQFWTYNEDEFLKNPVYSRDYPPAKNLEN